MNSKQMNRLAKSPKAMMDYQATGRLPRMVSPSSPLIDLLERIGYRRLDRILGVRVGPELGCQRTHTFRSAAQLLKWLKPADQIVEGESFPAEQHRIKNFQKTLTEDDLRRHCHRWYE
jgi:hypothetical protein